MTIFLLKLTVIWGLFALLYALLLRQETFFRANRAYLLGTAALGILLALPSDWLPRLSGEPSVSVAVLPAVTIGLQQVEAAAQKWDWLDYMWFAYGLGATLALFRMLWGLAQIMQMIVRGNQEQLPDGCVLVKTAEAKAPFSFFRWVFVPAGDQFSESYAVRAMLAHERAHARGQHSLDVLFAELLCVLFWFHPLAHWYRRSLRTVHEYLADAEASCFTDRKQYGLLLIQQAQSEMSLAFVNHFFQSPLKQRFVMLTRNASPALSAWKYGLALPAFALLFLFARQTPVLAQKEQTTRIRGITGPTQAADIPIQPKSQTPKPLAPQASMPEESQNDEGVLEMYSLDQPPIYPGGNQALIQFLTDHIKYPEAAIRDSVYGVSVVQFVIDKNGEVESAEGLETDRSGWRQDFQDEAIRVVKTMPRWEPGRKKGEAVKVRLTLPVRFRLK